jgi:myo-inositol catabolism protein IolC
MAVADPIAWPAGTGTPTRKAAIMTDSTTARAGPPSAAQPLFILAMDHRDSFGRTQFGVHGTPAAGQLAGMRDAKELIFAAARRLTESTTGPGRLGILVDEQLGADVARQARQAGFVLAMPVEASGADRLTFEYGDEFAEHVEAFDPDWIKVLVRFNPADPADLRDAQTETLRRLHDWATGSRRRWLVELLVPPTRKQLAAHDDQALFDEHERPALTAQVIGSLTAAGVRPGIWKLEGYETTAGAQLVLDAVRDSGAPASSCIVLGRNAPRRQVDHWLTVAAPLPGYVGFAIGRSIWDQPIAGYLAGHADRDVTEARIAERYRHFVQQYFAADTAPAGETGERSEPFTYTHPRLTPDREALIRKAAAGADPRGSLLPAWMTQSLLAEVDALRTGQ